MMSLFLKFNNGSLLNAGAVRQMFGIRVNGIRWAQNVTLAQTGITSVWKTSGITSKCHNMETAQQFQLKHSDSKAG